MWLGLIALFFGQFSGSVSVVITKIGIQDISPPLFVFFRFLLAFIFFVPIYVFQKHSSLSRHNLRNLLVLSFFLFVNVCLFTIGVQFTTVIMTQILYAATPVVVGIMGHFLLGEKITK